MSGRSEQSGTGAGKTITVRISLHGRSEGQALPSARAYLFDRVGQLVDSKPVAGVSSPKKRSTRFIHDDDVGV